MKKRLHNRVNRLELLERLKADSRERTTISFYQYAHIGNPHLFRDHFYLALQEIEVMGRIYVSYEGVNAQISVPTKNIDALREELNKINFLNGIRLNVAIEDDGKSFFKLMIKVRNKIVADGLDDKSFDVTDIGTHLKAEEFNLMAEKQNSTIVDMRNHYESEIGHFKNAITPDVETFKDELPFVEKMLEDKKDEPLLLYCTGGIRCEKASAYFKHKGFKDVYQLEGGIIEYSRQVKKQNLENKFVGKNFVFDERLGERISEEIISNCHQCGTPCDSHTNCSNAACHILFIQCESCKTMYSACCSLKCKDYKDLPEDKKNEVSNTISFNGTLFGKGRYKALSKDQKLILD